MEHEDPHMIGRGAFRTAMAAKVAADKRRVYWQTQAWLLTERGRAAVKDPTINESAPPSDRQETAPAGEKNSAPVTDSPPSESDQ